MKQTINNLEKLIELTCEGMSPRGADATQVRETVELLARLGVFSQSRVNRVLAQRLYAEHYASGRMKALEAVAAEIGTQTNTVRTYIKRDW